MSVDISVIMPVYNEEESIVQSYMRLKRVLLEMEKAHEIICVDDGSRDRSLALLQDLAAQDAGLKVLSFSRNFGHQAAVTAGMKYASGRAIVIIDADLQDPPELIPGMFEKWLAGYDIVYGKRISREGESFFKLFTAKAFYWLINTLTGNMVPMDTGDFRLIDRKVLDTMNHMPEHARFLRGMGSWVGFKSYAYPYEREERFAGETKYTLKKMLRLASDGIFSFSYAPLLLPYLAGAGLLMGGLVWLILAACLHCAQWTLIASILLMVGGMILLCMGILGTYLGRVYEEAKCRPLYVIAEKIGFRKDE